MTEVRVVFRKWGERPHWEYDARLLGEDEHGTWFGTPTGTRLTRPGAAFEAPGCFVSVTHPDNAYVASFRDPLPGLDGWVEVYVDITTVPRWEGATVTMVDLDLDVVRAHSGRVWVDDEDEFAAHRVRFGYPPDVVALASATCDAVHADVVARKPPFDGLVGPAWLTRLRASS